MSARARTAGAQQVQEVRLRLADVVPSSTVSVIIASPAAASSAATAQPSSAWAQLNQNSLPRSIANDHTGSTASRTVAGRSAS